LWNHLRQLSNERDHHSSYLWYFVIYLNRTPVLSPLTIWPANFSIDVSTMSATRLLAWNRRMVRYYPVMKSILLRKFIKSCSVHTGWSK
jgi:hypothetical protein